VWREEVQEVEMLLESYFMHIDNIYNRLKVCIGWCRHRCCCLTPVVDAEKAVALVAWCRHCIISSLYDTFIV
jgi:hypothetical protein